MSSNAVGMKSLSSHLSVLLSKVLFRVQENVRKLMEKLVLIYKSKLNLLQLFEFENIYNTCIKYIFRLGK